MSFANRILMEEAGLSIGQRLSNNRPSRPVTARRKAPRVAPRVTARAIPTITSRRVAPAPTPAPRVPRNESFGTSMGRKVGRSLRQAGLMQSTPRQAQQQQAFNQHAADTKDIQNNINRLTNDNRKRMAGQRVQNDARARTAYQTQRQPLIDFADSEREKMSQQKWADRKQAVKTFTNDHVVPGAKLAGMSLGMGARDAVDTIGQGVNMAGRGLLNAGKSYLKHMPRKNWN